MPVCHHPSLFTRRENICSNVSSANRLPSVPVCNSHHSRPISPKHAGMVTDEKIESKGLAWRRTRQDDQAGQFVSWGRDHSQVCINFLHPLVSQISAFICLKHELCLKSPVVPVRGGFHLYQFILPASPSPFHLPLKSISKLQMYAPVFPFRRIWLVASSTG